MCMCFLFVLFGGNTTRAGDNERWTDGKKSLQKNVRWSWTRAREHSSFITGYSQKSLLSFVRFIFFSAQVFSLFWLLVCCVDGNSFLTQFISAFFRSRFCVFSLLSCIRHLFVDVVPLIFLLRVAHSLTHSFTYPFWQSRVVVSALSVAAIGHTLAQLDQTLMRNERMTHGSSTKINRWNGEGPRHEWMIEKKNSYDSQMVGDDNANSIFTPFI